MVRWPNWSALATSATPSAHSKYNPIDHGLVGLEKKWNGVILNCLKVILMLCCG